jgi:hypothetical protein
MKLPAGGVQCRLHRHSQFIDVSDTAASPRRGPAGAMFSRHRDAVGNVQNHSASVQPQGWQVSAATVRVHEAAHCQLFTVQQ